MNNLTWQQIEQALNKFILTRQEKLDVLEYINSTYDTTDITYDDFVGLIDDSLCTLTNKQGE